MTPPAGDAARSGLVLLPMRPTIYRVTPDRPLETVTMRPVEVWHDEEMRRLADARSDHVLHLVAPGAGDPVADPGGTLRRWRTDGVLSDVPVPGLFGWTWEMSGRQVRGVAGAVALPLAGSTVPHERVRPDVVGARARQMARADVQAEPIVVLHEGATLPVDAAIESADPLVDLAMGDERHRIWPITSPDLTAAIHSAVAAAPPPVVADGHHRLAALDGLPADGWTRAMVLLVDAARSDLSVGTVHRVVPGLELAHAATALGGQQTPVAGGAEDFWLSAAPPGHLRWVLADQDRQLGVDLTVEAVHALRPTAGGGCAPIALDTCHLHSHLLPALGVGETALGYAHDWAQARGTAATRAGFAVRTSAPKLSDVLTAARSGHLLPHKATSIGPKPRIGLLMLAGSTTP